MVKSLLDILRDVTLDPEQGAAYTADPSNYLAEQGYHDVADEDLREAFSLVADTLPPEHAQEVYTSHVAPGLQDSLQPLPTHEETDPGTVYGHTTEDFDLDLDDAVNEVVDPDAHDDGGLGFGDGADHDFDDDAHGMVSMDDLDDDLVDDPTVDDLDHAGLQVDANPFDETHDDLDADDQELHDDHDVDDDHGFHDTHGHHDVDDVDLGFF